MLLEPRQKKVATIASPRCGFVGTNPMLRSVPLSLNVPSFWSRTTFGATTSNIGSAGPRCSELMESRQAVASSAAARSAGMAAKVACFFMVCLLVECPRQASGTGG